jgi:thiol-disulfide isomerase/thioredoxin
MTSMMFAALLHSALLTPMANAYDEAYQLANDENRPLVVLIGADWCPACRTMKNATLPRLQRDGGLRDVAYAEVNTDQQSQLADRLLRGNSIPQLVIFYKDDGKWRSSRMIGARGEQEVQAAVRHAVPRHRGAAGSIASNPPSAASAAIAD